MTPVNLVVLAVLVFSIYLGWSLSRGYARGIRLYAIAAVVALSLLGAAAAQALGVPGLVESLNVVALALSLGALPSSPALWEDQVRADLNSARLYQPMLPADVLSWKAWLKVVNRLGARGAALCYLGIFIVALLLDLVALLSATQTVDRAFALAPLSAPGLLAVLSTVWLYRAARRLVPNA